MKLLRAPLIVIVATMVSAVLLAAGIAGIGAGTAAAQPAGTSARAAVPWNRVGAGWVLTQYASAPPEGGSGQSGWAALYLVSPGGTRYQLARWPDWRSAPQLVAWSPDGKRALFQAFSGKGGVELLTLATGRVSTFAMKGDPTPVGFTTPDGLAIVANRPSGSGFSLARYSLSGKLVHSLGYSADGQVLYAPSGTEFVTGTSYGLKLVVNNGTQIRRLPIPGASANSCNPVRWWNGGTVLVSCVPSGSAIPQLWLVPVGGARPTALTPRRSGSGGDLGDLDAWQLSSGLYLQSAGPCGVLQIFKQARGGSITLVKVPHTTGDNHVLTAAGSRLLIQAPTSCIGSNSLLWFNPATHSEQWLIRAPGNVIGVAMAIPFYSRENGNL
jgi:TolB protein